MSDVVASKSKISKETKRSHEGYGQRGAKVSFGDYGLMALEPGLITQRQIEAARIAMTRYVKRKWSNLDSDVSRQADDQ